MKTDQVRRRSTDEVFDDHLRLAAEHRFDEDIERNVAPHCVILERRGIFHGRDCWRRSYQTPPTSTRTG